MAPEEPWTITGCSVEDGVSIAITMLPGHVSISFYDFKKADLVEKAALAANSIPAFWADPNWVLSWQHRTLEYHVSQVAKRIPRNLLGERDRNRHQKVIDPVTNQILGYARWTLPAEFATKPDGTPTWSEAVVPAVSPEEEAEVRRVAATAVWDPNQESDVLSEPVTALREPLLAKKPYLRK